MHKIINVPVELIRRIRWDKRSLEMLVCAIMIKRKYQNSVLYDLRVTNVMTFFCVSHKKALKLIEAFKDSEFFVYNDKKNCIFAKSFKSKCAVEYGYRKNKFKAFEDYCRKMQLEDEMKLRNVVREMRNILALCEINAVECTKDNLIVGSKTNNFVTQPEAMMAIPQRKMAFAMGFSRSSACRYIKELIKDRRVSKTQIVAECVIPVLNDTTEREWYEKHPKQKFLAWHDPKNGGWSGWIMLGSVYSIIKREDSDAFQHVIYNYRYGSEVEATCSSELDGKWPHN